MCIASTQYANIEDVIFRQVQPARVELRHELQQPDDRSSVNAAANSRFSTKSLMWRIELLLVANITFYGGDRG